MTKTKAKTTKAASKKAAAPKKAAATKPAKNASAAKSTAKKAAPAAKAKKSAKTTAKEAVVVEAQKSKAQPVRAAESKPLAKPARVAETKVASKPAADFGAGLAAPRDVAKPTPRPEAAKPAPAPAPAPKPAAASVAVAETDAPEGSGEVAEFLRNCDHARVADFVQVRKLILEASSSIEEGIKWNAPSFRTSEWFATFHLRDPNKVAVVFHLGAKKRDNSQRIPVGAPEGMVEWLATDRCMVTVDDVKRRGKALQAFVRGWILHV